MAKKDGIEISFNKRQVDAAFMDILDQVAPNTSKVLEEVTLELMQNAQANWPVRQLSTMTPRQREEALLNNRQHSVDMFDRGIRITSDSVFAYVRNTAQYAWAIRAGAKSVNKTKNHLMVPLGRRVANELLWKPARKNTDKVLKVLANDLGKSIK